MSSSDQASARGMSLLLLIPYSRVFCTGIYFREFHEFLLIVKMLDTIPSAHTYIRKCVSMQHQTRSCYIAICWPPTVKTATTPDDPDDPADHTPSVPHGMILH